MTSVSAQCLCTPTPMRTCLMAAVVTTLTLGTAFGAPPDMGMGDVRVVEGDTAREPSTSPSPCRRPRRNRPPSSTTTSRQDAVAPCTTCGSRLPATPGPSLDPTAQACGATARRSSRISWPATRASPLTTTSSTKACCSCGLRPVLGRSFLHLKDGVDAGVVLVAEAGDGPHLEQVDAPVRDRRIVDVNRNHLANDDVVH